MGKELKRFEFDDGQVLVEKCCEQYVCKFCGAKAAACNYVGDLCLQVYARHEGLCGAFVNDDTYSGFISECATCNYLVSNITCFFSEEKNDSATALSCGFPHRE